MLNFFQINPIKNDPLCSPIWKIKETCKITIMDYLHVTLMVTEILMARAADGQKYYEYTSNVIPIKQNLCKKIQTVRIVGSWNKPLKKTDGQKGAQTDRQKVWKICLWCYS